MTDKEEIMTDKTTVGEQSRMAIEALENAIFEIRCAHERILSETHNFLVIICKEEERWVVDVDSEHILEDEGGYPTLELQVHTIRAL